MNHFHILGLSCALLATGCAMGQEITPRSVKFHNAIADTANRTMVLNILRASHREPIHFTSISKITGQVELSGTVSVDPSLTRGMAKTVETIAGVASEDFTTVDTDTNKLATSVGGGIKTKPIWDVINLDSQEFMYGILTPITPDMFQYYLDQGWPPELLLYLFVEKVEVNGQTYKNDPDKDSRVGVSKFDNWVKRATSIAFKNEKAKPCDPIGGYYYEGNLGPPSEIAKLATEDLTLKTETGTFQGPSGPVTERYFVCKEKSELKFKYNRAKYAVYPLSRSDKNSDKSKIYLRSIHAIIFYLGEVVRETPSLDVDRIKVCRLDTAGDPRIEAHKCRDLFKIYGIKNLPIKDLKQDGRIALTVDYEGKTYAVGDGVHDGKDTDDRSMQVISLLHQLVGLNRAGKEPPSTQSVNVIN